LVNFKALAAYRYWLVPIDPETQINGELVVEQTIASDGKYNVGDVVPASPGTWTVERIGYGGSTAWASEAIGRDDPQTETSLTLYCRIDS
jgi:hypothetical protein